MKIIDIYPKNNKILFIGPYPPPLGGVSVHIKRITHILKKEGYNIHICNTSKNCQSRYINFFNLLKSIYLGNYDIIHIHGLSIKTDLMIFLFKYLKKYKIYFTDHNPRLLINKNKFKTYFINRFIVNLDYLIVVSDLILENYKKSGVKFPENIIVKNAFLPPPIEEANQIEQTYSDESKEFIKTHKPMLIANAYEVAFYRNIDLYGLDLCVELTHRLKRNFPNIGFLFALANEEVNTAYIHDVKQNIKALSINNNFHFMTGQKELWPLFKRADLGIRPTLTDGDALSVREALSFNCPVIASDVVKRPRGTICFKSRDIDDLYRCAYQVLRADNYALSMP